MTKITYSTHHIQQEEVNSWRDCHCEAAPASDHFTPFATRQERRIELDPTIAEIILGPTRAGRLLILFAALCLGISGALVLKRAPEIARAEQMERPA